MAKLGVAVFVAYVAVVYAQYDYADVIRKSLLFYQAQRSGYLSGMDSSLYWRGDSALYDLGDNGEDLTGGYYDAGDHVKFGFPMAFAMTTMAWGILDYSSGYNSASSMDEARNAIRWGMDYLAKAHVATYEFYGQVGDPDLDHNYWGRPEDMTMERPAYKITESAPGSDLAAETAAAMAAGYLVLRDSDDASYTQALLDHAITLFNFADNYRGVYSNSIAKASPYYASSGYEDELVWGAMWLYRATADSTYLNKAIEYYNSFGIQYRSGFSWDEKSSGATALLARYTGDSTYSTTLQSYCDYMVYSQTRTPLGLIFYSDWGSLRAVSNALFVCLQAADLGIQSSVYRDTASEQMGYILGNNGFSYVAGYGSNYPLSPHHRSSSCPDTPETCDWNTFNGNQINAHVLNGGLVGGPDANDAYTDTRQDATHNEVALDYNAAFQGVAAALLQLGY